MREVCDIIQLIASKRCTVLISGETGTGKEVIARAIHAASPRSRSPLLALNCAALPSELVEAELFGTPRERSRAHMRAAWAASSKRIGVLSSSMKSASCRVLRSQSFYECCRNRRFNA